MKALVIDIETSALEPSDGAILEIGIVKVDFDKKTVDPVEDIMIKEENFSSMVSKSAWIFQNSDLTYEDVKKNGVPLDGDLKTKLQGLFDNNSVTAYNSYFDIGWLGSRGFSFPLEGECLMHTATPIVKIPHPWNGGYKWPNFQETWDYFFPSTDYMESHRALDDALHEGQVCLKMYEMGYWAP